MELVSRPLRKAGKRGQLEAECLWPKEETSVQRKRRLVQARLAAPRHASLEVLRALGHAGVLHGRFRRFYTGFTFRSFSWTLRGQPSGVRYALRHMWEWSDASTCSGIPQHLVLDEAPLARRLSD